MNIKKPNSFARYGNDYVAPLTTIDQIVKPSGERYTNKEFELMSNVENVMFGEYCAGKNLLNPTLQTQTFHGVTITNNGDGTYTLNGTATDGINFALLQNNTTLQLPKGTFKILCSNDVSRYYIASSFNGIECYENRDTNYFNNVNRTILVDYLFVQIPSGKTFNNDVIKPMITDDLEATYDDFEPYAKSLRQLTDSALNMDLLWTNASPTSAFGGQEIDVYAMNYKFIAISFRNFTYYGEYSEIIMPTDNIGVYYALTVNTENRSVIQSRGITLHNGKVQFLDGYKANVVENNGIIPYKIYGIR